MLYLITDKVLDQWKEFEKKQSKKESNQNYFYEKEEIINKNNFADGNLENEIIKKYIEDYDNYYKGSTINTDLENYKFDIGVK